MRLNIAVWVLATMSALVSPSIGLAGVLTVDFADGTNNVPVTAAPFVFANGTAGPIIRNFTAGSPGYVGNSFDTGAGINATLRSFRSTDGALNTSVLRMIDRNNSNADLVSDWATIEPGGSPPTIGMQLTLTGMGSGIYNFSSFHDDTSNQAGIFDAQYSVDGGATWINLVDNASYTNGATVSLNEVLLNSANGFNIRYLAGGGLFGGNGQGTDTVASNRLFPLNSFVLTAVPEPKGMLVWLILGVGMTALSCKFGWRKKQCSL